MTTPLPWNMVERGEDSQGNPLFDIVSGSADLIVARDVWREDAEHILKSVNGATPSLDAIAESPPRFDHEHILVQHRDGKPPWCRKCGRDATGKIPRSRLEGTK